MIYKTIIVELTISNYLLRPIIKFVNYSYQSTNFVPYELINDNIIIKEHESVRNLGSIYDIICLKKYGYILQIENFIQQNLDYYWLKYQLNPRKMRQASAFMLLAMNQYDHLIYHTQINIITDNLYHALFDRN